MDFSFMGGSMGERRRREVRRAPATRRSSAARRCITVSSSGGARMQEGILSLMQLPKTICAVEDAARRRAADVRRARASDHGRRARELRLARRRDDRRARRADRLHRPARRSRAITREKLPDDFALAEHNLRFGHIDAIVPRSEQRPYLARLLRLFAR